MSTKSTSNDNIKNALDSIENATEQSSNDGVTGVEVLKGDKVIYEEGDFEEQNSETQSNSNKEDKSDEEDKSDKEDKSGKEDKSDKEDESDKEDKHSTTIANIYQWASKLKAEFISNKDGKSDSNNKEISSKSDQDDKNSVTIANIYQWASKLKDDFTSEAFNMTHEVSEKALAMMLTRLIDGAEAELEAFNKKSEESDSNTVEERRKITDKKDKYQSMLDQLRS